MSSSQECLVEFLQTGSEAAFREVVRQHIHWVYAAALRRTGGDTQLAEEITQTVFIDLSRNHGGAPEPALSNWLHRRTGEVARTMLRGELRRKARELQAAHMNASTHESESPVSWEEIAPFLDGALDQLGAKDRHAILLRYFERQSMRTIGVVLGVSDDAAQKRISRALGKLRGLLLRRGVALSLGALAATLSAQPAIVAPAHVVTAACENAARVGKAGLSTTSASHPGWLRLKVAIGFAIIVTSLLVVLWPGRAPPTVGVATGMDSNQKTQPTVPRRTAAIALGSRTAMPPESQSADIFRLIVRTAATDQPIPHAQVHYQSSDGMTGKIVMLESDAVGVCEMPMRRDSLASVQMFVGAEDFAQAWLEWHWERGEIPPPSYVLRLGPAVPIGGRVVDVDGRPVAGASVSFANISDSGGSPPVRHGFGHIAITTGDDGRWQTHRIAEDLLNDLVLTIRHTNYSGVTFRPRTDVGVEEQLRAGNHLTTLQPHRLSVLGQVMDETGQPIADAWVHLGNLSRSEAPSSQSGPDGTFLISNGEAGKTTLTAEADGWAASTIPLELTENLAPVQLVLKAGRRIRLRVVNKVGEPLAQARVSLNRDGATARSRGVTPLGVRTEFRALTDAAGRVVWEHTPEGHLLFDFNARGFMTQWGIEAAPGDEEKTVTLAPALTVTGEVRDARSGRLLPRFRVQFGMPVKPRFPGLPDVEWLGTSVIWFQGGNFRNTFQDPISVNNQTPPRFVLRFEAENYTPFISRVISAAEGTAQLEITLEPISTQRLTVIQPDGKPAASAEIGLAGPGAYLSLERGRFEHSFTSGMNEFRKTAGDGTAEVPETGFVAVVHASGYAEATAATLAQEPTLRLQPWGRLEGVLRAGGKPVAKQKLYLVHAPAATQRYFSGGKTFGAETDAEGRFAFDKVAPGHTRVFRDEPVKLGFAPTQELEVDLPPGETTTVAIERSAK